MKTAPEDLIKNSLRIVVIGSSCAGKSTLAFRLSELLALKYIQLDALYWKADWQAREKDEFNELVINEINSEKWAVDGNYGIIRHLIWPKAEIVIWLNYDFSLVLKRALVRTIKRIVTKEELFSGNRETFKKSFFDKDSILWWVITTFHRRRKEIPLMLKEKEYEHLKVIEIRKAKELDKLLASIKKSGFIISEKD
jgi:adenylate kinase family enzyme